MADTINWSISPTGKGASINGSGENATVTFDTSYKTATTYTVTCTSGSHKGTFIVKRNGEGCSGGGGGGGSLGKVSLTIVNSLDRAVTMENGFCCLLENCAGYGYVRTSCLKFTSSSTFTIPAGGSQTFTNIDIPNDKSTNCDNDYLMGCNFASSSNAGVTKYGNNLFLYDLCHDGTTILGPLQSNSLTFKDGGSYTFTITGLKSSYNDTGRGC